MAYAIELEGQLEAFYTAHLATNELFADYAKRSAKHKAKIVQTRQEYVTEMILEPITGLDEGNYALSIPESVGDPLAEAIRIEGRVAQFYRETGAKLNVTETIRIFAKLATEHDERIDEIKG
jgi:hypothetical protein